MNKLLLLVTILALVTSGAAITRTAASCNLIDVQAQVSAAQDGDVVSVPAGPCSWSGTLTWNDVNFTLQGASSCTVPTGQEGCTPMGSAGPSASSAVSTIITWSGSAAISATLNTKPFRITGFYFLRNADAIAIAINQNSAYLNTKVNGIRIDHNVFNDSAFSGVNDVQVNGWVFGLQDHNTHYVPLGIQSTLITEYAIGESDSNLSALSGSTAWARPQTLGTADSWYVEDSILYTGNSVGSSSWPNPIIGDGTAGNRFVVRHSTFCGAAVETHGAYSRGSRGTSQWEVYDNDFYPYFSDCATDASINAGYQYDAIKLRGGTGVIFNNKFHGGSWDSSGGPIYFDVERGNDANAHAPINTRCGSGALYDGNVTYGYPCLDQIGRGPGTATPSGPDTETLWPVMLWGNVKCAGFGCTSVSNVNNVVIDSNIATHPYQSDLLQSGRDWVFLNGTGESNSSTSPISQTYASFTYPHPLQNSGTNVTLTTVVTPSGGGTINKCPAGSYVLGSAFTCVVGWGSDNPLVSLAGCEGTYNKLCSGSSCTSTLTGTLSSSCTVTATFTSGGSVVPTPSLSPTSGTVPVTVTATYATGSTLLYTLDGTIPTASSTCAPINGASSSGSITFSWTFISSITLNVIGCETGYTSSPMVTGTYTGATFGSVFKGVYKHKGYIQ